MFSVTRKAGEQVVIGPDVIVKVLEVVAGRVRLGIEAPSGSSVRRGEAAASTLAAALAAGPGRGPRQVP
jgi:carbon storage regulator CsrA